MTAVPGLVTQLMQAARVAQPLQPLTGRRMDCVEGYRMQRELLRQRQAAGERVSGWKIALAEPAARQRFNLDEPVYGVLTDAMRLGPMSRVDLFGLIRPKLEIELAFILGQDLPPGACTDDAIATALAQVAPAFEVADSRWMDWRFDAGAFVADNAAAARYCLGPELAIESVRDTPIDFRLDRGGECCGQGQIRLSEGVLLERVHWLIRRLLADGHTLAAGQVILSGALLLPLDIQPADYRLRMLGTDLVLGFESRPNGCGASQRTG